MAIIKAGNNRVVADDPELGDNFVQVVWFGPSQDGLHRKVFEGPVEGIEEYDAVVDWAVKMAPQFVDPVYVVPLTSASAMRTDYVQQAVASLDDQQRGDLRRQMMARLTQIVRDCNDPVVRADAREVLAQMKVVRP